MNMFKSLVDDQQLADYFIEEGETPTQLAQDFYNDPNAFWIFYYINDIIDFFFDWPMKYADLVEYTKNKYGTEWDRVGFYDYEGVLYPRDTLIDMEFLPIAIYDIVNEGQNVSIDQPGVIPITNLEYEMRVNDDRRMIKVLRPEEFGVTIENFNKRMNNIRLQENPE